MKGNPRRGYVHGPLPRRETRRTARRKCLMERRLHYQSCYIYFYLRSQGIHPNEVQMMCASRQGHPDSYFLAVNNRGNMGRVRGALNVVNNIIMLNIDNNRDLIIQGHDSRHEARKQSQNIINGLENDEFLDFTGVEFVTNENDENAYNGRHAEEFLCDRALTLREEGYTNFFIYGKRRPCITCRVKMETARINHFNRKHGRLFLHTTDGNRLTNEEQTSLITILGNEPSNITKRITRGRDGRIIEQETTTHYASENPMTFLNE